MIVFRRISKEGFTLAELVIGFTVIAIVMLAFFGLFSALINSTVIAKQKSVATTLATNQMEYVKSLPYSQLAVAGGSIYSTNPLPANSTQEVDGVTYTTNLSINYVDDAFDGCANYPTPELKQLYCRNQPSPSGAPAIDTNPQDYKIVHVATMGPNNKKLAEVDTHISARVAETASTTGALFVTVLDSNGSPVSGATVHVTNSTIGPPVDLSDSSDSNGVAIFYGLPPDTSGFDYYIGASKSGYSSLTTTKPSGSLQPNYTNQNIFTQQSSSVTLVIDKQSQNSIVIEAVDTSGNPVDNTKIYTKGGYKKYTDSANTNYYYDNLSPSDTRPTTNASGLTSLKDLSPGTYIFCGDNGDTSCTRGGTQYYLAAAVPYGGQNSLNPIVVPTSDTTASFSFESSAYVQKVRLILTTSSSFPRIKNITPDSLGLSDGNLNMLTFTINGTNLPCSSSPGSCATTVTFKQGSNTYPATCTGNAGGQTISCQADLSTVSAGIVSLIISSGGQTLTLPGSPLLGGLIVSP